MLLANHFLHINFTIWVLYCQCSGWFTMFVVSFPLIITQSRYICPSLSPAINGLIATQIVHRRNYHLKGDFTRRNIRCNMLCNMLHRMLHRMFCNKSPPLTRTERYANLLHATRNKLEQILFCWVLHATNLNIKCNNQYKSGLWTRDKTRFMVRFDDERNAKFIDEFKASAPWLWGVSGPDYHRGEVQNCDM